MDLRHDLPQIGAQYTLEGDVLHFQYGDFQAQPAGGRGDFAADESAAEHDDTFSRGQLLREALCVGDAAQVQHPVASQVRQLAGTSAGGQQQRVVVQVPALAQGQGRTGGVEPGGVGVRAARRRGRHTSRPG